MAGASEAQTASAFAGDGSTGAIHPHLGRQRLIHWHARYTQQARWTRELRAHLFARAGLETAEEVLEVGCGTGAVLQEFASAPARVNGLDIQMAALKACGTNAPFALLTRGNASALPFDDGTFDIVFCHYLLLWVREPVEALQEMKRVTRSGGSVLACAEPDHTRRVDRPPELETLGRLQTEALARQGANPAMGRQLQAAFEEAGLRIAECGKMKSAAMAWTPAERQAEWRVLESDLNGVVDHAELARLRQIDATAWEKGTRVLEVPTHFAWGLLP